MVNAGHQTQRVHVRKQRGRRNGGTHRVRRAEATLHAEAPESDRKCYHSLEDGYISYVPLPRISRGVRAVRIRSPVPAEVRMASWPWLHSTLRHNVSTHDDTRSTAFDTIH